MQLTDDQTHMPRFIQEGADKSHRQLTSDTPSVICLCMREHTMMRATINHPSMHERNIMHDCAALCTFILPLIILHINADENFADFYINNTHKLTQMFQSLFVLLFPYLLTFFLYYKIFYGQ